VQAEITLTTRINTGTTASPVQTFISTTSQTITLSAYLAENFVIATGVSAFRVSFNLFSNVNTLVLMANSTLRVNVLNWMNTAAASGISAGSAGGQFKDFFMIAGSGISGPLALEFANSTADSVAVTAIFGM